MEIHIDCLKLIMSFMTDIDATNFTICSKVLYDLLKNGEYWKKQCIIFNRKNKQHSWISFYSKMIVKYCYECHKRRRKLFKYNNVRICRKCKSSKYKLKATVNNKNKIERLQQELKKWNLNIPPNYNFIKGKCSMPVDKLAYQIVLNKFAKQYLPYGEIVERSKDGDFCLLNGVQKRVRILIECILGGKIRIFPWMLKGKRLHNYLTKIEKRLEVMDYDCSLRDSSTGIFASSNKL